METSYYQIPKIYATVLSRVAQISISIQKVPDTFTLPKYVPKIWIFKECAKPHLKCSQPVNLSFPRISLIFYIIMIKTFRLQIKQKNVYYHSTFSDLIVEKTTYRLFLWETAIYSILSKHVQTLTLIIYIVP